MPSEPIAPSRLTVPSVFFSDAKEIETKPMLKALTYASEPATAWYASGAQLLGLSGWRPDFKVAQEVTVPRALPPSCQPESPIIIGSPDSMQHLPRGHGAELNRKIYSGKV